MPPVLTRILQRLLAVTIGLALVLGAMEIVMRLAGEVPRQRNPLRGFHQTHAQLGWLGVPDYEARFGQDDFDVMVKLGPEGFRLPEHGVTGFAADAPKVAVLGDSFTWGWGVEQGEVYTDQLQQQLGTRAEVRNFGINAYGTGQQLELYREFVAPWKPDVVVLAVFTNDFHDNVDEKGGRRPFYSMEDGRLTLNNVPVRRAIAGRSRDLSRFSVAISYLHFHVDQAVAKWKASRKEALAAESGNAGAPAEGAGPVIPEEEQVIFDGLLAALQGEVGPETRLWVLYIPERHEVLAGRNDGRGDFVAATCAAHGLPFFDLTPGLAQVLSEMPGPHPGALPLYFPHDMHWAAAGHRAVGRILARDLPWGELASHGK
ncbi:MAG: GDSL-type esterase/lipase family protein [Planctomycetota bacterium]